MSEQKPPPLPASNTKLWWFGWIFGTVVIPGSSLPLLSASPADKNAMLAVGSLGVLGAVALALHMTASIKLSSYRSSMMTALLIVGGWLLMAVSFFAGCLALMK